MPDPVREVPAGRAPAHQQARRRGLHAARTRRRPRRSRKHPRHRLLQPAPRRAQQQAVASSACSSTRALVSEKDIETAVGNARVNNIDVEQGPDRGLQRPARKRSAARWPRSTTRRSSTTTARRPCPPDLKERVTVRVLKKNVVRAGRAAGGHAGRRGRGPARPHAPRRHQGHEPRAALRVPGGAEARHPRRTSTQSYGEQPRTADGRRTSADWAEDHRLRSAKARRSSSRTTPNGRAGDRRDRQRHREARATRSSSTAYNTRRLGHPRRALRQDDARASIRLRIDGDCQKYMEIPGAAPQRARAAPQDHGQARHLREAQAAGRQDPLQGLDGHDRAARRDHPDRERQRGRGHAHPRRVEAAAAREDGLLASATSREFKTILAEAVRHLPRGRARPAPARPPRCTPASATSTPWT